MIINKINVNNKKAASKTPFNLIILSPERREKKFASTHQLIQTGDYVETHTHTQQAGPGQQNSYVVESGTKVQQ